MDALNYSFLLRSIGMQMKRIADEQLRKIGLNSQQGQVIGYIFEHQTAGIIQQDLAQRFDRKGASISSMLQGLEKKGYIRREIVKENERQKKIYVLEKGERLIEKLNMTFSCIENQLLLNFDQNEKKQIWQFLEKMQTNLMDMEED